VCGLSDPATGLRFDRAKVLLERYGGEVVVPDGYSREGDNAATGMKSMVVDPAAYDWEGDSPLHLPSARTIDHLRDACPRLHAASELGRA
jgi:glycogen operon protein